MPQLTTTRTTEADNSWISEIFREEQRLLWVHVVYTSTATVGNRQIVFQLKNTDGNVIYDAHAGAVQAASNVYHYEFMQGIYRETAFIDNAINVPIPVDLILPAGTTITIYDSANIAVGDSMVINYQSEDYQ